MKINIQKKKLNLDYITDKVTHEFELEMDKFDEDTREWEKYRERKQVLTQIQGEMILTERSSIPGQSREWYVVYAHHFNDLNPDGTYQDLRAYPVPLDTVIIPDNKKNVCPEIKQAVMDAFPNHNIGLKLKINSAITASVEQGVHYDTRDIFRPLLREFVEYIIQQGLKEVK